MKAQTTSPPPNNVNDLLARLDFHAEHSPIELDLITTYRELQVLDEINQAVLQNTPLPQIITLVEKAFGEISQAQALTIYLYERRSQQLVAQNLGMDAKLLRGIEKITRVNLLDFAPLLRPGYRIAEAFWNGKSFVESDPPAIAALYAEFTEDTKLKKLINPVMKFLEIKYLGVIPLVAGDQSLGLIIFNTRANLPPQELERMNRIATQVALILAKFKADETNRYQAILFQNVKDAIIATDLEFNIESWNEAAETLYGWSAGEVIGQPLNQILQTEYATLPWEKVLQIFLEQGSWQGQVIQHHRHGMPLNVYASVALIKDDAGKSVGAVAVNQDITKRVKLENELKIRSEHLEARVTVRTSELQRAQEQALRSHRLLLALSQAAQAVQRALTPAEIYATVGKEVSALGYDAMLFILAEDKIRFHIPYMTFDSTVLRAVEKMIHRSVEDYYFPLVENGLYQQMLRNGETCFTDDTHEYIAEALPQSVRAAARPITAFMKLDQSIFAPLVVSGEIIGFLNVTGFGLDESDIPAVTTFANQIAISLENARLIQETKHQEERYRTLFEAKSDTIFMVDAVTLEILDANPAAVTMYGYSQAELLAMRATDLSLEPEKTRQEIQNLGGGMPANSGSQRIFVPARYHKKKDGTIFTVEISAGCFEFQGKTVNISTIRDISERVQMEAEITRHMSELQAIGSMTAIINQSLNVEEILNKALAEVFTLVKVEAGTIFLLDPDTGDLALAAHYNVPDEILELIQRIEPGTGLSGKVAQTGIPQVTGRVEEYTGDLQDFVDRDQMQSIAGIPLVGTSGVMGVMSLTTAHPQHFDSAGVDLMVAIGQQIAIGIEKARLYEETRTWATELEQRVVERTEELVTSETRYRTLAEAAQDFIFIINSHLQVQYVNHFGAAIFGMRAEELIGKPLKALFPQSADRQAESLRHIFQADETLYRENPFEFPGRTIWLGTRLAPIKNNQGEVIAVLGIARDISERIATETALKKTEALYQDLYDNAPDMYVSVDASNGNIKQCNRTLEIATGYTRDEIIGRPVFEMYHPDSLADAQDAFQTFVTTGEINDTELQLRRIDGSPIDVSLNVSAVRDNQGKITSSRSSWRDISARKQIERELQQYSERLEEMVAERTRDLESAQEALVRQEKLAVLGQLAGGLAHELRTPLTTIKNVANFIPMVLGDPESDTLEMIGLLDNAVTKSDHIISSLLTFARPQLALQQPVNLVELIRTIVSNLTIPPNILIDMDFANISQRIIADPNQLEIVFSNLILNALQAMPDGGMLSIQGHHVTGLEGQAEFILVAIKDTGVGISPENWPRLFEPLFSTKTTGIGLGLAISKILVEGQGGRIEVESEAGAGSTFSVQMAVKK